MNNPLPFRPDPLKDFRRALAVKALAFVRDRDINQTAERLYGKAEGDLIAKAATNPTTTDDVGGFAGVRIGPFLRALRGRSAAAQLMVLAPDVDLTGLASITLPRATTEFPNASWVAEGGPAPVFRGTLAATTLVPRKLMALSALTNELAEYSAGVAEQVISDMLEDSAARALDAKLFSTDAATATAPAGILNGIAATAGTAGGGVVAVATDLRALTAAVAAAGGGARLAVIASPPQAMTLQVLAGSGFTTPVIIGPSLAPGTVIVLDYGAFISGFSGDPQIDVADSAVVHLEDATPAHIGTAGTPNTVAAPTRSAFQADLKVLRCILRASWAMRAPAIAYTTTATW